MVDIAQDIETARWREQHLKKMRNLNKMQQVMADKQEEKIEQLQEKLKYFSDSLQLKKPPEMEVDGHANGSTKVGEKPFLADDGLVSEIHHANFCSDIDYLACAVRGGVSYKSVSAKDIAKSVGEIFADLAKGELSYEEQKLKKAVSKDFKSLIVECGVFAAKGSSPEFLNVAASNLATSVAELLQLVRIRPCPPGDFSHLNDSETFSEDSKPPPRTLGQMAQELCCSESSQSESSSYGDPDAEANVSIATNYTWERVSFLQSHDELQVAS